MKNGAPIMLAALAASFYLALTEPQRNAAQQTADTPTVAAPVQSATIQPVQPTPTLAIAWQPRRVAEALQRQTRQPIVYLVTNEDGSCAPCLQLANGPLEDAGVVTWLNTEVIPVKLSPREMGIVQRNGRLLPTPTLRIVYADGRVAYPRRPYPLSGTVFLGWLRGIVK